MTRFDRDNDNELYIQYFNIGVTSYREKVKFYEQHILNRDALDFESQVDIDLDYLQALFEVGKYHRFLSKVDHYIELVIMENIELHNGEDIYSVLLFKKAACLYNLHQYEASLVILEQLQKIDPGNEVAPRLRYKCTRQLHKNRDETFRAVSVVSLLCGVSLKVAEILVIEPFYDEYLDKFHLIANSLIAFSFGLYAIYELYCQYSFVKNSKKA